MSTTTLTNTNPLTAAALVEMPNGHVRRELVRGELREMSPSSAKHVIVAARLNELLSRFVREHDLGLVFTCEGGFLIERDPDTVLAPDAAFVSKANIPATGIPDTGYWHGAPDLAVEVTSPHDRWHEVEEKVQLWLAAGARLVWVINPQRRNAVVFRTAQAVGWLQASDELTGEDVIPGFTCRLTDIFV